MLPLFVCSVPSLPQLPQLSPNVVISNRCFSPRCTVGAQSGNTLPMRPLPELGPVDVVEVVCSGLEYNNWPMCDAGIERLYHFLTPRGRVELAPPPPKHGMQGGVTMDDFVASAASPALGALILCSSYSLVGEPTISPGNMQGTRGRLATQKIVVRNDPEDDEMHALLGADPQYRQALLDAVREGRMPPPLSSPPSGVPAQVEVLVQLEEQLRPPHQNCWLLKELFPLMRTKLQQLNAGGEEFEGAASD
eukprot:CAMPEP_0119314488 /NCGR_PEP_ID=MMETSP1333-20130426/32905_1 /TAXON_ID=418940 /ORGANISM="Scyphosphaera apsteinii, Strain RCC1455" /LENGTH=248 /DNA_ID=CAMNT_0007319603 /DNA_START=21 /DNA_END=767 /DNA_ORIENTATION=-